MTTARTVLGGAVAVLLVLVGARALDRWLLDGSGVGAEPTGLPAPLDGARWVGMDDVVVAVPRWWTTGQTQCLAPVEDTVYFDPSAQADCSEPADPATVREVSALAVLDGSRGYGEWKLRSMAPVAEADGHEVVELPGCERWFEGVCRRLFGVPDLGVVFAVTIADPGDGDYEAIRDSLRILPDALTTVPLEVEDWTPAWSAEPGVARELVGTLERAGLRVEVARVTSGRTDAAMEAGLPPGSLLDVTPALGSVVDDGATVTVTVLGER